MAGVSVKSQYHKPFSPGVRLEYAICLTFAEEMRVQRALVCVTDHLSRRNRHVLAMSLKPRMTDILAIQIESGLL